MLILNVNIYIILETNSKKKWNALIWASCNGYTKLVKILISKGAALQYL